MDVKECDNMAILLTNGKYYISHNKTGAVIKVSDIEQAQNFYTVEKAERQINKTPGKCCGYYCIDTEVTPIETVVQSETRTKKIKKKSAVKRKHYSEEQRRTIYEKADGCCQLCGRRIGFHDMTVDHIIPLEKGGSNDLDNIQAACAVCNRFKANVYPDVFFDRITEIFMYQMGKQYNDNLAWKMARNMLMEIL